VLDVVRVTAPSIGESLEECLVEVATEADRRRRDPLVSRLGEEGGELIGIGNAGVGVPIRHEHDPVRLPG